MMTNHNFQDPQSYIISLDPDNRLVEKLQKLKSLGFKTIEINGSEASLISEIIQKHSDLTVGAGNIINTQQLEDCYQAGVHFASSPGFLAAIAQTALIYSIDYYPGVATISEAMQVKALGYHCVRPLPADFNFCRLLAQTMPSLQQHPSHVEASRSQSYLQIASVKAVNLHNPDLTELEALSCSSVLA